MAHGGVLVRAKRLDVTADEILAAERPLPSANAIDITEMYDGARA